MIEEADAWFEYLEATRGQTAPATRELEPWAWARLMQRLRAIRAPPREAAPPRPRRAAASPEPLLACEQAYATLFALICSARRARRPGAARARTRRRIRLPLPWFRRPCSEEQEPTR